MVYNPQYALFYDFHTSPEIKGIGKNFDAEKLTDRFVECGVDYVTFHARCNMGMAYYDTKLGTRHPSLKFDLFGQLAEACHKKGIALGAYFNVGLSRAEGIAHRDWTTVYPDGQMYHQPFDGPFSLTMCYNSPYREHLIAMVLDYANAADHWHIAPDNREGVRISFNLDGGVNNAWFLLRLSVHDPVMPLNAESDVPGGVEKMLRELHALLSASELPLDLAPLKAAAKL